MLIEIQEHIFIFIFFVLYFMNYTERFYLYTNIQYLQKYCQKKINFLMKIVHTMSFVREKL